MTRSGEEARQRPPTTEPSDAWQQKFRKADARIRTADPFITSEVLYQLSYVGADRIVEA
jgi:hypothetical protein